MTEPNPGSPAAVRKGCTCPILDNANGNGINGDGKLFWMNQTCPIHGGKADD